MVFDLLRDNHLSSLKTLDLSDNPKSIGAEQITKLANSFFSGNNNLESLDISCIYPPPTDLRKDGNQEKGEHLGGDQYKSGNENLRYAFSKLLVSAATCNQPLCVTIDAVIYNPQEGYMPEYGLHRAPFSFIPQDTVWCGEPAYFKTTSVNMVNHIRQVLPMTRDIREKQLLIYKKPFPHNVEKLPNVVENFTWGITKCLTPKTLNKADFEWIQEDYHHYQEFDYLLPKIVQLTQNPLEVFVCITEVMEDSVISHDMLNYKAKWEDVFSSEYIARSIGIRKISGLDGLTKQPVTKGKVNTQTFDSNCKHCDERQLKEIGDSIRSDTLESEELFAALFGRDNWARMGVRGQEQEERKDGGREERPEEFSVIPFASARHYEVGSIKMNPYLLQVDVTTIINLNLSHSNMDDVGANIVSNLLKRGSLPNLKSLDVSGNQITPTGEGFFARALQSPLAQDIMITIKKYTTDLGQQVIKPALKEFLQDVHKLGVEISHFKTTQGSIEYLGAYLAGHLSRDGFLFTTPGAKMSEHMAHLCKKGGEEVINFILGISNCHPDNPAPLIKNVVEGNLGELVKDGVIEAIGNKAIQKIDIFMCISEAIDEYPVSSDILDCIGSFSALFDE